MERIRLRTFVRSRLLLRLGALNSIPPSRARLAFGPIARAHAAAIVQVSNTDGFDGLYVLGADDIFTSRGTM